MTQPYASIAPAVQPPPAGAEPIWDGQQWVYPAQHAVVQHVDPAGTLAPAGPSSVAPPMASPSIHALSPAPSVSSHAAAAPSQTYPTQPYPASQPASAPIRGPSPGHQQGPTTYGITEGLQAMSMSGAPTSSAVAPLASPSLVRHQLHDPPVGAAARENGVSSSPLGAQNVGAHAQPLYAPNVAAAAAGEQQQYHQQQQHHQHHQEGGQVQGSGQGQGQDVSEDELEEQARREWAEYERKKAEYDAYIASQAAAGAGGAVSGQQQVTPQMS